MPNINSMYNFKLTKTISTKLEIRNIKITRSLSTSSFNRSPPWTQLHAPNAKEVPKLNITHKKVNLWIIPLSYAQFITTQNAMVNTAIPQNGPC